MCGGRKEFLVSTAKNDDLVGRMECAKAMVAQIDALSQERAGVVRGYENDASHLAKTGSPIIDAVVSIMRYRAKEKGITIDVRVPCDVQQLIPAGEDHRRFWRRSVNMPCRVRCCGSHSSPSEDYGIP